jgi:hypothetical protein
MTINGTVTTQLPVPLEHPGSTKTITITLSSQTGEESTYTVTVTRLLSSDNNLKALSVTPGPLSPDFDSDQPTYTVDVATNVINVTVAATKSDPDAVMQIGSGSESVSVPGGTTSGQANVQLGVPGTATRVLVDVTAPNGKKKAYSITVNRLLSSDNNLRALEVDPGTLDPPFAAGTLQYTVGVATDVTQVTVTATKSDPDAVISGAVPNEGAAIVPLDGPGTQKDISITVTAPNGNHKTYIITVKRAASNNNNLSALGVAPGSLEPEFASNILSYTVDVGAKVVSITVTATKADANAVISGAVPNEGQATIQLDGPGTRKDISITVTAQNGSSKTYRIRINRLASTDSTLSALGVSAGSLDPPTFAPSTVNYTVNVGILVGSVTITATKSDPNAVMSALGSVIAAAGTPTGQVTISPGLGPNPPVNILVIAQDGVTRTTYTVTVTRSLF